MCRDRDKDRDRVRDKNGLTEAEFLARYDAGKYPRPSVTADVAAFTHTDGRPRVLLVRRGGHPFIGTWALPGGFVEPEETVETAARRELWEETGIENAPVRQIGTYSDPHRDPRTRVITVAFYSCLDGLPAQPKAGDDAAEAGAFEIVRRKRFPIKPMSVEEAILQMDLLEHTFFVFRDVAADGAVSVVYRRKDGGYGLISDATE